MPLWLFFGTGIGTNRELCKLDFVHYGRPFVWVPAKTAVNLVTLDYVYFGQPFVSYARG